MGQEKPGELNWIQSLTLDLEKRWGLWLAIGNAAGLGVCANTISDHLGDPISYLLLPSCWAFSFGLVFAGATNFFDKKAGQFAHRISDSKLWNPEESRKSFRVFINLTKFAEIGCVVGFLVGLFYPLVVLTVRLFIKGSLLS